MRARLRLTTASLLVLLAAPAAPAQSRMWIRDDLSLPEGARGEQVFIRAQHDFTLAGFQISVRFDPQELAVREVTLEGTSVFSELGDFVEESTGFWGGQSARIEAGEIIYGAAFDISIPLGNYLPPDDSRSLVRLTVDVLAPPGTTCPLELRNIRLDPNSSIILTNSLVDPEGNAHDVETSSGAIRVTSIDERRALVDPVQGFEARKIEGGTKAVLFAGELRWDGVIEDGLWTRLRFAARGAGDESELLGGLSLHLDVDRDGVLDAEDPPLDGPVILEADGGRATFRFSERLAPGESRCFLLVAEIESGPAQAGLVPGLLLLGGVLCLARKLRASRGDGSSAALLPLLLCLAFSSSFTACGGGGGGGGGGTASAGPSSTEVRFDIAGPEDVTLEGASTGVPAQLEGLPLRGPALEV